MQAHRGRVPAAVPRAPRAAGRHGRMGRAGIDRRHGRTSSGCRRVPLDIEGSPCWCVCVASRAAHVESTDQPHT